MELCLGGVVSILERIPLQNNRAMEIEQLEEAALYLLHRIFKIMRSRDKNSEYHPRRSSFVQRLSDFIFRKIWERTDTLLSKCLKEVLLVKSNIDIEIGIAQESLLTVARALAKFKKWFYNDDNFMFINVRPQLLFSRHPLLVIGVGSEVTYV